MIKGYCKPDARSSRICGAAHKNLDNKGRTAILDTDKTMNSVSRVNPLDSYPYFTLNTVRASQAALKGDNLQPAAAIAPTPILPVSTKGLGLDFANEYDGKGFNAFA
jgi:hypothetical protein